MDSVEQRAGSPQPSRAPEAIGALSRIDEAVVQSALAIPKSGRVFDLELDSRIPPIAEGLFVALLLKITGATGSFVRPVLVV
jgi:hypothetical protein